MSGTLPKIQVIDPNSRGSTWHANSPSDVPDRDSSENRRLSRLYSAGSSAVESRATSSGLPSPTKSHTRHSGTFSVLSSQSVRDVTGHEHAEAQSAIDPLTQQILKRTNTQGAVRTSGGEGVGESKLSGETLPLDVSGGNVAKDRRKRVSFFSRIIGAKKKDPVDPNANADEDSEQDDNRLEGMDAAPFARPVDNMSYNPRHPQPPGYIKVRARNKKGKPEFDRVFLAQELLGNPMSGDGAKGLRKGSSEIQNPTSMEKRPIWTMEFSKDGRYLAAGGQDKVVRVWAVISSPEERRAHEREEEAGSVPAGQQAVHLSAPVFQKEPFREYSGHTSTILDLSWSKNNFLLSSSMDKSVRLWHVSRSECLCTFKHSDFVPSIQFHPRDDRFFLAGSLDSKLRLWSIPDKSVAFWNQMPEMITAVSFTPDGKTCIAGCLNGLCLFYETEGLKYQTQILVKSNHGKNAKGSKITGIQTCLLPKGDPNGEVKVLISSNDSRIRLYNFRDKSLDIKYKGHENNYSQIRATCCEDGCHVICGSEDRKVYIWNNSSPVEGEKRDKRPVEMFEAHATITTSAILAPTKTRQFLSQSEDPIYDLCNPPPVTLMSRAESVNSSRPPTENGSSHAMPPAADSALKKAESPAYIARSTHKGGQIIITADYAGSIKVFRQDCAFGKRRNDSWDSSSLFSKRVNSTLGGRTGSINAQRASYLRRDSVSTQPSSERILSWRQSIRSSASLDRASRSGHKGRSISPRKSLTQLSMTSSKARFDSPVPAPVPHDRFGSAGTDSPVVSLNRSSIDIPLPKKNGPQASSEAEADNPLWIQGDQSYLFWNKQTWKDQGPQHQQHADHLEQPEARSKSGSIASILSSELTDGDGQGDDPGRQAEEDIKCKSCGSTSFKAKVLKNDVRQLVCTQCGTPA